MTTTTKPKTCKNKMCKIQFKPRRINGLPASGFCPECDHERNMAKRRKQADEMNRRDQKEAKNGLKSKIRQVSGKQEIKNRELSKIKKSLPSRCVISGCFHHGSDLAHLLNKNLYPEYYLEAKNLVRMCRDHHDRFDESIEFRHEQVELYIQVASFDLMAANKAFNY